MAERFNLPEKADVSNINQDSLLVDKKFLNSKGEAHFKKFMKLVPDRVKTQIIGIEFLLCKNLINVNLAVGLTDFVRNLLNLPNSYTPYESPIE